MCVCTSVSHHHRTGAAHTHTFSLCSLTHTHTHRYTAYPIHCLCALFSLCSLTHGIRNTHAIPRAPQVRRHAAEQLYLQLLALDTSSPHPTTASYSPTAAPASPPPPPPPLESVSDAACDLLLATAWDGDMEPAKAARDALAALVGVPVPKMKAPAASARAAAAPRDENASYQALLDDFARGY